jgi:hypothetical protein
MQHETNQRFRFLATLLLAFEGRNAPQSSGLYPTRITFAEVQTGFLLIKSGSHFISPSVSLSKTEWGGRYFGGGNDGFR